MVIGEAAGKALDHSDLPIGGAEQHRPASEVILSTVEHRHYLPAFDGCKTKQTRATLCLHRDSALS